LLKIHETTTETGELAPVFLRFEAGVLEIVCAEGTFPLSTQALDSVLLRFGAPFDAAAEIGIVATLELGEGRSLSHVRHLAGYDVVGRDYLVYDREGNESLCALAATVTAALMHLGRAAVSAVQ